MKFAEPVWLYIGAAVCAALILLFRASNQGRRRMLELFAARHLLDRLTAGVSLQRRFLKQVLWVVAMASFFVALARPQYGFVWQEAKRYGIDILFAVDTSKSMLTQDVKPDRLTRAKLAVEDLANNVEGDRLGLIAFAGAAFLQCPLTLDQNAFLESVDALDTNIIPRGGTDIASAIHEAQQDFSGQPGNRKIMVLLTDGEDLEGSALAAARAASQAGIKIYTVGVGTPEGELIPVKDENGGVSFVKDENGQVVKSHLDQKMLREIAEATGARYEPLGQRGEGLERIYQEELKPLPRQELTSRQERVYIERFQWPLALGLICLAIELLLVEGRTPPQAPPPPSKIRPVFSASRGEKLKSFTRGGITVLFLWALTLTPASASPQSAERAYRQGKYDEALTEYKAAAEKDPGQPALPYNAGAAAYKGKDYTVAAASFQKSINQPDLGLQEPSYYNLGNTLYREGEKTEKSDKKQTVAKWEKAIEMYEGALKLKPDDADAKFNLEFVMKKLEELKKEQQKEQNQHNQSQNQKDQQQKQAQGQQQQQQQGQNPQQQNQSQQNQQQNQKDQQQKQNQPQNSKDQQQKQGQGQPQPKPNPQDQQNQGPPAQAKDSKGDQNEQPRPTATGSEGQGKEEEAGRRPGQISRAEAAELLDSMKGEEMRLPAISHKNQEYRDEDKPKKDW